MDIRKIILSALGLLLIVGAIFAAKWIIDSNVKEDPKIKKVFYPILKPEKHIQEIISWLKKQN